MIKMISHTLDKLVQILHHPSGWVLAIALSIANYFAEHSFIVSLVVIVTLIDAAWGIAVSVNQGRFTLSELARLTVAKLAVYGCALFVFIGLDKMVNCTISTPLVAAAIVLVEFWSSCGSMLVLFPDFIFLRLIKGALAGEIASKLHISEEKAKQLIEGEHAG